MPSVPPAEVIARPPPATPTVTELPPAVTLISSLDTTVAVPPLANKAIFSSGVPIKSILMPSPAIPESVSHTLP